MKLEIGYNHPLEIRRYPYSFERLSGMKILYLSDFHYNRFTRRSAENISEKINALNPDIILLGGDYADSTTGLHHFGCMLESISHCRHIFAIAGNHDKWRIRQLRTIVEANNGVWLQNRSALVNAGGSSIRLDGGRPAHVSQPADFSILCLHKPIDFTAVAHQYNLIFAGHLHGGQVVVRSAAGGLYPGRLLYTWNRLSDHLGNCQYLISKGLGDTLPIRYNCRKDVILVEIQGGPAPAEIKLHQ